MHWAWRAAIAVGVAWAWSVIWRIRMTYASHLAGQWVEDVLGTRGWTSLIVTLGIDVALPALVAVITYALLSLRVDPETRCRKCHYILRGITEPRCPECGEAI